MKKNHNREKEEKEGRKYVITEHREDGVMRSREGYVMGTPHYMPPEQAEGKVDEIDRRSDVYALGGILYSILTGLRPVEGQSQEEVLEKVKSEGVSRPTTRLGKKRDRSGTGSAEEQTENAERHKEVQQGKTEDVQEKSIPRELEEVVMKARAKLKEFREQMKKGDEAFDEEKFAVAIREYEQAKEMKRKLETKTLLEEGWLAREELHRVSEKIEEARRKKSRKKGRKLVTGAEELLREAKSKEDRKETLAILMKAQAKMWRAVELVPGRTKWKKKLEKISKRENRLEMLEMSDELRLLRRIFERINEYVKKGKSMDPLLDKADEIHGRLKAKDSADAWWMRGLLSFGLGRNKKPIQFFREALKLKEDHTLSLLGLGRVLVEKGVFQVLNAKLSGQIVNFNRAILRQFQKGAQRIKQAKQEGTQGLMERIGPSYLKTYIQRHMDVAPLYGLLGRERFKTLEQRIQKRMSRRDEYHADLHYLSGLMWYMRGEKSDVQELLKLRKKGIRHFKKVIKEQVNALSFPGNWGFSSKQS